MNMKRRIFGLTLVSVATAVLVACGGGGSSAPVASTSSLSVVPAKGAIYGATVTAYGPNGSTSLATGTTAASTATNPGKASLDIPAANATGLVIVKVAGNSNATYFNESTGLPVAMSDSTVFATVLSSVTSGASAGVTPFTTMALKLAGVNVSSLGSSSYTAPTLTAADINKAGARVLLALGLPTDFNLFAAPTAATTTTDPTDLYGALLAQMSKNAGADPLTYFNNLIRDTPIVPAGTTDMTTVTGYAAFVTASLRARNDIDTIKGNLPVAIEIGESNAAPNSSDLTAATNALGASVSSGTPPGASGSGSGTGSGTGTGSALPPG